jgi:hypothetical protein
MKLGAVAYTAGVKIIFWREQKCIENFAQQHCVAGLVLRTGPDGLAVPPAIAAGPLK